MNGNKPRCLPPVPVCGLPAGETPLEGSELVPICQAGAVVVVPSSAFTFGIATPGGSEGDVQRNIGGKFGGTDALNFIGDTLIVQAPGGGPGFVVIGQPTPNQALSIQGGITLDNGAGVSADIEPNSDGTNTLIDFNNPSLGTTCLRAGRLGGLTYGSVTQFIDMSNNGLVYSGYGVAGSGFASHRFNANEALGAGDWISSYSNNGTVKSAWRGDGAPVSQAKVAGTTVPWFLPVYDNTNTLIGYAPLYGATF